MPHKRVAQTNLDSILYDKLRDRLGSSKHYTFVITTGTDIRYRLFHHRFLLTHGHQWKGGDGIIGALGPIARGDKKYRARNSQIGRDYDTLVCGHYHTYMVPPGIIVNGSLKGYDEYAYAWGFPFQPPIQALWLTHPKHGLTCFWPIYADAPPTRRDTTWAAIGG
jgi:hypothetical protein